MKIQSLSLSFAAGTVVWLLACFAVDTNAPALNPIYPADRSTLIDGKFTLLWETVPGAASYHIQLADNEDWSDKSMYSKVLDATHMEMPTPTSPEDGSYLLIETPKLSWRSTLDAIAYDLELHESTPHGGRC